MALRPSQKSTREWPLLILAVALVCTLCVPLWQWSSNNQPDDESQPLTPTQRIGRLLLGPEQIACYCAVAWAGFILAGRYLEVRRQQRAFGLHLLPTEDRRVHPARRRALAPTQGRTNGGTRWPYILANMIRLALGKYAISRSGRDVSETIRTQADVDLGRLVSSMATVHYLAWAIPAIGFLGTVRGLAMTMGGEIAKARSHLTVAFDCTLVALALSLVVMFFLHNVQRDEEGLVIDCQQYCLDNLITRLYELEPEHADEGTPV